MLQVGPFEMTSAQESFWEIVKYFDFLVADYGFKTQTMEIINSREFVSVSYFHPKTRRSVIITENPEGGTTVSFKMYGFLGRCIIKEEEHMSIKAFADYIRNKHFAKTIPSKQYNTLAIPDLETKDEIYWSMYKSLYYLIRKHYSIQEFEIGERILIKYRLKHNTVIATATKPFSNNWNITVKKWGRTIESHTSAMAIKSLS